VSCQCGSWQLVHASWPGRDSIRRRENDVDVTESARAFVLRGYPLGGKRTSDATATGSCERWTLFSKEKGTCLSEYRRPRLVLASTGPSASVIIRRVTLPPPALISTSGGISFLSLSLSQGSGERSLLSFSSNKKVDQPPGMRQSRFPKVIRVVTAD